MRTSEAVVAFLGTGLMGAPMALRLHHQGYRVIAWNRSPEKLPPLVAAGVATADTPAAALVDATLIVLMLSDAGAIRETLLTPPALSGLAGRTVLQMGTIAPQESQAVAQAVAAAGGSYLEAPVLGSIPQAKSGELILMVGATPEQLDRWRPLLECFGPEPQLMGPVGAGSGVKLAMNQLIGTLTAAFSMSLGLVQQQGIDVEKFMGIVRQSALYAPTFDKKLQRMCDRNFDNPNFPTKHLLKDMRLFIQATAGLDARVAQAVAELAEGAVADGLADQDYSAIFAAVQPES